jgi:hypothetical protein
VGSTNRRITVQVNPGIDPDTVRKIVNAKRADRVAQVQPPVLKKKKFKQMLVRMWGKDILYTFGGNVY